ncbi:hypothetical protein L6452_06081 [Arctium lappa]|uniref:Uncharacterized protein n=1 Tax=Arctium lappa TaxID=4217 RepID=A0ACB9EJ82_ARCLA|nr:hypothetical protein L6452_06081 [Arctium lappa]
MGLPSCRLPVVLYPRVDQRPPPSYVATASIAAATEADQIVIIVEDIFGSQPLNGASFGRSYQQAFRGIDSLARCLI